MKRNYLKISQPFLIPWMYFAKSNFPHLHSKQRRANWMVNLISKILNGWMNWMPQPKILSHRQAKILNGMRASLSITRRYLNLAWDFSKPQIKMTIYRINRRWISLYIKRLCYFQVRKLERLLFICMMQVLVATSKPGWFWIMKKKKLSVSF